MYNLFVVESKLLNKSVPVEEKTRKGNKKWKVLISLVKAYIKTGEPIGSSYLKENYLKAISTSTIRNYFAMLEKDGYLKQKHASGGRIPTTKAYKAYAKEQLEKQEIGKEDNLFLSTLLSNKSKKIALYLRESAEAVSELTQCAVCISSPYFDQDFVVQMKLVNLDKNRNLCVMITNFGLVYTDIIYLPKGNNNINLQKLEEYFMYRITGNNKPDWTIAEEQLAKNSYNEIVLRHLVHYTNLQKEEFYIGGFSNLLSYSEFQDPKILCTALSLFENKSYLNKILEKCKTISGINYWIGTDVEKIVLTSCNCTVVASNYKINTCPVGSIVILGPKRMDYQKVFGIVNKTIEYMSNNLTDIMYTHKIKYKSQPDNIKKIGFDQMGLSYKSLIEKI